jgi:hypothetical protein
VHPNLFTPNHKKRLDDNFRHHIFELTQAPSTQPGSGSKQASSKQKNGFLTRYS